MAGPALPQEKIAGGTLSFFDKTRIIKRRHPVIALGGLPPREGILDDQEEMSMLSMLLDFLFARRVPILLTLCTLVVAVVVVKILLSRLRAAASGGKAAPELQSLLPAGIRLVVYGAALLLILAFWGLTDTPLWRAVALPLLNAAITLVVGLVLIQVLLRILARVLPHTKLDPTMHPFLLTVSRIGLYVLLALVVLPSLGVEITPLLTALGAVGLAVSLAVKDSLANLMGGALVLLSKPFVAGDFVEIGSLSGTVAEVGLIYTFLNTTDNKRICIPNGQVSTSQVVNYSSEPLRRLDITFSIGYGDDFEKARSAILEVVGRQDTALQDPAPVVRMSQHGASSIDLICRVWVHNEDYWDLKYNLLEQVKAAFDREGISIPFPQMDVHLDRMG